MNMDGPQTVCALCCREPGGCSCTAQLLGPRVTYIDLFYAARIVRHFAEGKLRAFDVGGLICLDPAYFAAIAERMEIAAEVMKEEL
jgi:hypothetical protein